MNIKDGKVSAHAKRDRVVLGRLGISLEGVEFDPLLASYLLNPGRRTYALEDLSFEFLEERRSPGTAGIAAVDAAVDPTARAAGVGRRQARSSKTGSSVTASSAPAYPRSCWA